jgi:hypothetical protein
LGDFVGTWGSVIGLALDILGAFLVFIGVYVAPRQALALEQQAVQETIADIGAPEVAAKNEGFNRDRAFERLRASRSAAMGMAFFVAGFLFQMAGSWPKK